MIDINNLIKKYNKFNDIMVSYNNNINYSKINNLDIYNNIINNKLLLYEPIEYTGFILLLDFDYFNLNKINILIDSRYYSFIELLKYQRDLDDKYYMTDHIWNSLAENHINYLKNYIKIEAAIDIKYDIIIIQNINLLEEYKKKLTEEGIIIYIANLCDIDSINNEMILISPVILKLTGEFIVIYKKNSIIKKDSINKFLKNHINKLIKNLKKKIKLFRLGNINIQKKLISVFDNKVKTQIINLMNKYDIPLKPNIIDYYKKKLLSITNKLYVSINLLSYQFINYENIKYEIDNINTEYINLNNIAINLNKIKSAIDTRNLKKWYVVTFELDNYKSLGNYISLNYNIFNNKTIKVSNAFLKIYELLSTYNFFDLERPTLKSFHFCEAPGMFILGINHFINTRTKIKIWDWFGNSLEATDDNKALNDDYKLMKNYPNRWLNGDIRKIKNINFLKDKLGEVEFITSDCGICVDYSDMNKYEEFIAETDFAQFVNMLNLLSINGSGILKAFIPLVKASNISIIYLLTQVFKKVFLSKPITSRPHNSEIYIVCLEFKGIDNIILKKLINMLDKEDKDKDKDGKFDANVTFIKNIPDSFIKQLEDYILEISRQQISYLLNIFYFLDNTSELGQIKLLKDNKLKDNTNLYWCDKFKIISSNSGNKLV